MIFYVDFDDCLCETARSFTEIAARLFGKKVPYEEVRFFNLQKSFDLNEEEYQLLMEEGHRPEALLAYDETLGASQVINEWLNQGNEVNIITGRPYSAYEASRQWLDEHGLERVKLFCLNKYGRDAFVYTYEWDESIGTTVVFLPGGQLWDVSFLKLDDFTYEDGISRFNFREEYSLERMDERQALYVELVFPGDTPHFGIAYTDATGTRHYYALEVSGMDGSLSPSHSNHDTA